MSVLQPVAVSVENILVATDFSAASGKAARYAAGIARHFGSRMEIVHIFDPSVVTSYEEAIIAMPAVDRKQISDENLTNFASGLPLDGVPTKVLAAEGHRPHATLLDIAGEHNVDLIVAGTESKSGLSRLLLGSTAEQLIRGASCPVITVGPNVRTPPNGPIVFTRILYATDFSPEAAKAAPIALSFAEDSAAHLYCCCVLGLSDEGLETRKELYAAFERRLQALIPKSSYDWCTPSSIVEYGEAADVILNLARHLDADLIVLGARKSSFWLTRVEGGLTPALLAEAECPVMTI